MLAQQDAGLSRELARERQFILAALLLLAAGGWALVAWQSDGMGGGGITMGMGAPLFVAMWVAMMVAMMFPTAAPMVLTFARVSGGRRERGQAYVPTWVFVAAYLVVWIAFGAAAYGAAAALERAADTSPWLTEHARRIGGGILVFAGLYQLSPLKRTCLSKCRTPLDFIMTSWKEGHAGAVRMGVEHGVYCLGCCWMLFVILFPLGIMNVPAMAAITALIFAEKSLPMGRQAAMLAFLGLIVYGAIVIALPDALPATTMQMSSMES